MVWSIAAIAWNTLYRSLVLAGTVPGPSLLQACQKIATLPFRSGTPAHGWAHINGIIVPACFVIMGLFVTINEQRQYQKQRHAAQR